MQVEKPYEKFCHKSSIKLVGGCEELSLLLSSAVHKHSWYVCSSHCVLLYDTRCLKNFQKSWTHLLGAPPSLSYTTFEQNEEVIYLASQDPGEVIRIVDKSTEDISYVQGLPDLRDTLLAAKDCELWLDPEVQQHAKFSLTGLVGLSPLLFVQTSVGDVFSQRHYKSSSEKQFANEVVLKCLRNWEEEKLKERKSDVLKATSVLSMKHPYKCK